MVDWYVKYQGIDLVHQHQPTGVYKYIIKKEIMVKNMVYYLTNISEII